MVNGKSLKAYKVLDSEFKCQGFQFQVGKFYILKGDIKVHKNGFHAFLSPMDVFKQQITDSSRYALVELSGTIDKNDDESIASASCIEIKEELHIKDIVKAMIEVVNEKTSNLISSDVTDEGLGEERMWSVDDLAKFNSSGFNARIISSGDEAQIASSGFRTKIGSASYAACIASEGDYTQISSSGDYTQIASSGDISSISSSGDRSKIAISGEYSKLTSSGFVAKIGSSSYAAQIASSGDEARIVSEGDCTHIASSGEYAIVSSKGAQSVIMCSNYSSVVKSTGEQSVIMCAGSNSIVKASLGSWITLTEWDDSQGIQTPICVKTEFVDGDRIKADTIYKLVNGEFKEVVK